MKLFCFGFGYSASVFAKKLDWDEVTGTHRADFPLSEEILQKLSEATHVLLSIPPDENGDLVIRENYKMNPEWVGYLSTTGVYGNHDGGWVDEDTPTNPNQERSKWRVIAENQWLESGYPVQIFRLSGIYGPTTKTPLPEGGVGGGLNGHKQFRPTNKNLVEKARDLRKNLSEPERKLWQKIKSKQLDDIKFRHQEPISNYIVDFISYEKNLIIEIDGDSHASSEKYDNKRTAELKIMGFKVIRFTNNDVMNNVDGVLSSIVRECENPPPTPPSGRGATVRSNVFDALENGTARRIDKPNQYFSRIHVEDIAEILKNSLTHGKAGEVYNCADDEPCPQEEVVRYAAEVMGAPPPPLVKFEEAELSPMARSFYSSSRKVKNDKIKSILGTKLAYSTYRQGLDKIWKER